MLTFASTVRIFVCRVGGLGWAGGLNVVVGCPLSAVYLIDRIVSFPHDWGYADG